MSGDAPLDRAAWGHLACHGTFRADNPLFSHLQLADGPLTVADLSALRQAPGLLMLSSCDAGGPGHTVGTASFVCMGAG